LPLMLNCLSVFSMKWTCRSTATCLNKFVVSKVTV
jgi:hypothetical protein